MLAREKNWTDFFSKKPAPYGKELNEIQKEGKKPKDSVYIFIGKNAWIKGKHFHMSYPKRTLVLPPWQIPDYYSWPVKGCDVLVFDTSGNDSNGADDEYVMEITLSLYRNGAEIVRFVNKKYELSVYRKEQ